MEITSGFPQRKTASTTIIHLIHSGWRSSADWEEARVWQERAWKMAFENLKEIADHSNG